MLDLMTLPIILVARGCLAPYFLEWWQKNSQSILHILDFSRWRWFENGNMPEWIETKAPPKGKVVLFDRNTTTGQTLRILKYWLIIQGYKPIILGHLDKNMGRFGIQFLDYVWDDGEGYDRFGLSCNGAGVKLISRDEYLKNNQLGGAYTICVVGGRIPELGGMETPNVIDLKSARPSEVSGTVVFQNVESWKKAMVLGYVNKKPLIIASPDKTIIADYHPSDFDFSDLVKEANG